MAKQRLSAEDNFLVWCAQAPLIEVEAQYRRIGAVVAARRRETRTRAVPRRIKANGGTGVTIPLTNTTIQGSVEAKGLAGGSN